MARRLWKPSKDWVITDQSTAWQSNSEIILEAAEDAKFDIASLLAQLEISRQLDRIATALEKRA